MLRTATACGWAVLAATTASAFMSPGPLPAAERRRPAAACAASMVTTVPKKVAEAERKTDRAHAASPSLEDEFTSMLASPENKKRTRAPVLCGICGQVKRGHTCTGPPPMSMLPIQGSARRHHGFDRRLRQPLPERDQKVPAVPDLPAAPPQGDARDALHGQPAIQLYNSWAADGRDLVMEITHEPFFAQLWDHLQASYPRFRAGASTGSFTAIDAGCGNGWAARKLAQQAECQSVVGVDAAAMMVDRARELSTQSPSVSDKVRFEIGDMQSWETGEQVDLVVACESLYYAADPLAALTHIVSKCLKPDGVLAATVDCYAENKLSRSWAKDLGVPLHCRSEKEWKDMLEAAGLSDVVVQRSKDQKTWWPDKHSLRQGTLLVSGRRIAGASFSFPPPALSVSPGAACQRQAAVVWSDQGPRPRKRRRPKSEKWRLQAPSGEAFAPAHTRQTELEVATASCLGRGLGAKERPLNTRFNPTSAAGQRRLTLPPPATSQRGLPQIFAAVRLAEKYDVISAYGAPSAARAGAGFSPSGCYARNPGAGPRRGNWATLFPPE